jgi:peroxiredoxin Q/BCP
MIQLQVGDKAPAINSIDETGNPITLTQYKGKKIILYFYPKDDTPGCTKEACSFRDNYALLQKKGFVVLGVRVDSDKKHQKFIQKYELNFSLIADTEQKVMLLK